MSIAPPESMTTASAIGMANGGEREDKQKAVIAALQAKLDERERQLEEQTNSLIEMESTLTELQSLIGTAQVHAQHSISPTLIIPVRNLEDADASQLRALLREKNEKLQILNAEFDSHRADFRSTIDTLELASTETVRVYEKRVEELLQDIRELHERSEDVESVAQQLKQLEELVAELEEGLEDARRGEAEARGEVEFLRGEVERSKEELRREKEKSAAAVANAAVGNMMRNNTAEELEKKDEEIRGLKAIIHSLSQDHISDDEGHIPRKNGLERSKSVPNIHSRRLEKMVANGEDVENKDVEHKDVEELLAKERDMREILEDRVKELEEEIELQKELVRQKELEQKPDASLEDRIKELEAQLVAKAEHESQLEREIELMERDRRNSVMSDKPPPKLNPVITAMTEKFNEATRPSMESSIAPNADFQKENANIRDSRGSVGSWMSAKADSTLPSAAEDTDTDDDTEALWCEICDSAGHDLLTCTMFGSSANSKPPLMTDMDMKIDTAVSTPIDVDREIAPLSLFKMASPIEQAGDEPAISDTSTGTTRKKSVHLPLPPPMVEGGAGNFGPVAGKESGVIDDKWCALCERDGHDSVDCPFDEDSY